MTHKLIPERRNLFKALTFNVFFILSPPHPSLSFSSLSVFCAFWIFFFFFFLPTQQLQEGFGIKFHTKASISWRAWPNKSCSEDEMGLGGSVKPRFGRAGSLCAHPWAFQPCRERLQQLPRGCQEPSEGLGKPWLLQSSRKKKKKEREKGKKLDPCML